jgi:DNA-binding FrmR family transcriptional regulator
MTETEEVEVSREALRKRLRRIEGQIRGIEKMIADSWQRLGGAR